MVIELTDETTFDNILANNSNVICKFYATWCGPCKSYASTFSSAADTNDEVPFISIDVDHFPAIASKYGVRSVPTTITFSNGSVNQVKTGAMSKEDVVTLLLK